MEWFARRLRGMPAPDLVLLLGLIAVVAAALALLVWPELLGLAIGRPRVA